MNSRKVAIVTGSGKQRLGWHVAQALAARGYSIAVHYNRSAYEAQRTVADFHGRGIDSISLQADLTDDRAACGVVEKTIAHFGRVDVLVNCAAIWQSKRLEEVTAKDVREHFETNLLGTFLCAQQAGLAMVRQAEGGSIVTFGDWATERPYRNYSAYFASKGSIVTLTRCLAVELGVRNPRVRVNCILPGPVMLPPDLPEPERQKVIDATLAKREGSPDHVAQAVMHFIENDFITGASLAIDGGRSVFSTDSAG